MYKKNPKALHGYTALIPTLQAAYPSASLDPSVTKLSPTVKENARLVYDSMLKGVKQAVDNGITIGIGNDAAMSYVTHYDMWREIDHYMRQTKLTNKKVIDMVTRNNAKILGIDDVTGTLDIGKQADLIVVDHNPLEQIEALSNISMVMVKGNLIQNPSVTHIKEVDEVLNLVW